MPKRLPFSLLAAATLTLGGCGGKSSCVCAAIGNASDVITVDNDGGCGVVEQRFTDPRRSCFPASGSMTGPSTPLSLALEPAGAFGPELPSFPKPPGPPAGTAYLMR